MLVPISWLKEFVDIKLPLKELALRLTEVGLGVEEIKKDNDDYILNIEVTANRPDCLSIIGIAREVAALQNSTIKLPKIPDLNIPQKSLPLKVFNNFELCPRFTGLIIKNVVLAKSPKIIKDRLRKVGLRPINNLVDISNYLMIEIGNPVHIFDYDQILGHEMKISLSRGTEKFTSVDDISYLLPKNSLIYRNNKRVIDLCGIKGGLNSGVSEKTKNILIIVSIYNGIYIRKTAQKISVHSEASSIFERGVDAGNTLNTLKIISGMILKNAGGEIASKILDYKEKEFNPWTITISLEKINKILGMNFKKEEIISILKRLNLTVETCYSMSLQIKIPTYRNDLHLEEDLIEEIARIYGYNKFPKTMPAGLIPTEKVAYSKDYQPNFQIKNLIKACGFSEIYTYSLISASQLSKIGSDPKLGLEIVNPVSTDYKYLRPTILPNILSAIFQNQPHFTEINLFELGKIYQGNNLANYSEEYQLILATNESGGVEKLKSVVDKISSEFNLPLSLVPENNNHLFQSDCLLTINLSGKNVGFLGQISENIKNNFQINNPVSVLYLNYSQLLTAFPNRKIFKPLPKYPAVIEDLTLIVPENALYADIIKTVKSSNPLILSVSFLGQYQNTYTLRINYQSPEKTLSSEDIKPIRQKILFSLEKINVRLKI